jgi:hypothetical protein
LGTEYRTGERKVSRLICLHENRTEENPRERENKLKHSKVMHLDFRHGSKQKTLVLVSEEEIAQKHTL